LPFYFSSDLTGLFKSFVDAFFESMSGFTTTGASIIPADSNRDVISLLPKSILFWRSLTHWIGGMGIILFSLAVLSALGIGGMMLYKAEVPGPIPNKISPTVSRTAKILWTVYIILSLAEFLLLWLFGYGMPAFDAICHTFGTMATGGFSTKDLSIGYYVSTGIPLASYFEIVITIFMFLAGVNFVLHFHLLKGRPGILVKNSEFRFYSILCLSAIFLISLNLFLNDHSLLKSGTSIFHTVKNAAFTSVSILTTTGYTTVDFDSWPNFSRFLIFLLMFVGACAGSTGGGMKIMRVIILLKHSYNEILKIIHSRAVYSVRLGTQIIPRNILSKILSFFILFIFLYVLGVLLLTFLGMDFLTAVSAAIASLGNIGPGLGDVGPTQNYSGLNDISKIILTLFMLLGRLEIYPILVIFIPQLWKK
jgi:trk system potassium uptake protein TrkH